MLLLRTVTTALLLVAGTGLAAQDVDPVVAAGRELVRLFYEGPAEALWERLAPSMRQQLGSPEKLAGFRQQVQSQLAEEITVLEERASADQGQDVYTRRSRFAAAGATLIETVFVIDATGSVTGFWIRPTQSQDAVPVAADETSTDELSTTQEGIRTSVPKAPTAFLAGSRNHLVYELRVANRRDTGIRLLAVEVVDAGSDRPLLTLTGDRLGAAYGGEASADLEPDTEILLYMWVTSDAGRPATLEHRLRILEPSGEALIGAISVTPGNAVPVLQPPPMVGAERTVQHLQASPRADRGRGATSDRPALCHRFRPGPRRRHLSRRP